MRARSSVKCTLQCTDMYWVKCNCVCTLLHTSLSYKVIIYHFTCLQSHIQTDTLITILHSHTKGGGTRYRDSVDITVEDNSSVVSLIRMRWLPSQGHASSNTLHQQNPPVLNRRLTCISTVERPSTWTTAAFDSFRQSLKTQLFGDLSA